MRAVGRAGIVRALSVEDASFDFDSCTVEEAVTVAASDMVEASG